MLNTSLQKMLECPVCLSIVRSSPVVCCSNGHILCSSCWCQTHLCPLCRVKLHDQEKCFSQTANTLLQVVSMPCTYQDEGCMAMGSLHTMDTHARICPYKAEQETQGRVLSCSTPGCKVAKQDRSKTGGNKQEASEAITPRRHCTDCGRDFSRGYFRRHVCVHGVWRDQNGS